MPRPTVDKVVMMPRRKAKTLIVVADSARARFFEPADGRLVEADRSEMVAPLARRPTREIVSDRPGRAFRSPTRGFNKHALEPAHDPQKLEKRKFTTRLAQALDEAVGGYDRLVVVAPKRSLGELRTLMSRRVQESVAHEIPKDLTTSTPQAVWKALTAVLPQPL